MSHLPSRKALQAAMPMVWRLSHRADRKARLIADRHYNRQKIGAPQFAPSGSCLVLYTENDTGAARAGRSRELVRMNDRSTETAGRCPASFGPCGRGCQDVCMDNLETDEQAALDAHNAAFDRWERMTDRERGDEIKRSMG